MPERASEPSPSAEAVAFPEAFASPRRAFFGGAWQAAGTPALVLGTSYLGFGSLVRENGLSLAVGLFSTLCAWALPGQIVVVELHAIGASLLAAFVAASLINFRLLPMVVSLFPLLHVAGRPRWHVYAAAHLVAVTGWAVAMARCPQLPRPQRLPFFVGFASLLWIASMTGTAAGFLLAASLPMQVSLGLVFVNPVYFMLLLLADLRHRGRVIALVMAAIVGPLLHPWLAGWGLLVTGVACGTAAYALDRALPRRHV